MFQINLRIKLLRVIIDVDAVSPCGVGGILTPQTIPKIKSKIVCGAANNQLGGKSNVDLIYKKFILFI